MREEEQKKWAVSLFGPQLQLLLVFQASARTQPGLMLLSGYEIAAVNFEQFFARRKARLEKSTTMGVRSIAGPLKRATA